MPSAQQRPGPPRQSGANGSWSSSTLPAVFFLNAAPSQFAVVEAELGINLVDVRLDRLRRVVGFRSLAPTRFVAGVIGNLVVLLRGRPTHAIGADQFVALEDRRAAARHVDLAAGDHR